MAAVTTTVQAARGNGHLAGASACRKERVRVACGRTPAGIVVRLRHCSRTSTRLPPEIQSVRRKVVGTVIIGKLWKALAAGINRIANLVRAADPIAQMQYEYDQAVAQLKEGREGLAQYRALVERVSR